MTYSNGGQEIQLNWSEDRSTVHWRWGVLDIKKKYESPPQSVVVVENPRSVLVVEPLSDGDSLNEAVVFNPDGTERVRINRPAVVPEPSWNIGFYTAFEDDQGIVLVFSTTVGDFWGRPDLKTGKLRDVKEWR